MTFPSRVRLAWKILWGFQPTVTFPPGTTRLPGPLKVGYGIRLEGAAQNVEIKNCRFIEGTKL